MISSERVKFGWEILAFLHEEKPISMIDQNYNQPKKEK